MSKLDSILKDLKNSNPKIVYRTLVDVRSRISKNKDDTRELLARGLVPQLLQILRREKTTGSKSSLAPVNVCLSLLGNLFTEFDGRKSITLHTAARDIPIICRFLLEGQEQGLLNRSVRALANLALDKSNMVAIVQEGTMTRLAELLEQTKDPACEQTYIRACRLFWPAPTARGSLVESGVPQSVARLLADSPDPAVQLASLRTLAEMLKFECGEDQARQLLQGGMMDRLVAMAKQECEHTSDCPGQPNSGVLAGAGGQGGKGGAAGTDDCLALEVLLMLMQNDHLRHAVGAAGGVTFFMDFVRERSGHPMFKAILNALCLCAKDSVNRVKIREGGGLGLYLRSLESPGLAALHDRVLSGLVCFVYDDASLRLLLEDSLVPCLIKHLHRCALVSPSLHRSLWARANLQSGKEIQEGQVTLAAEYNERHKNTMMRDLPDSVTKWLQGIKSACPGMEDAETADEKETQDGSSPLAATVPSHRGPGVEKLEAGAPVEFWGGCEAKTSGEMPQTTSVLEVNGKSCAEAFSENETSVQQGDDNIEDDRETEMSVASDIAQKCTVSSASPQHSGDGKGVMMEGMEGLEDTMQELKDLEDMVEEMECLEDIGGEAEGSQPQKRMRFSIHSPTYQAASEWSQETFSSGAKCKSDFGYLGLPPTPESPLSPLSHSTLYSPASVSSSHRSPAASPHSSSSSPPYSPFLSGSPEHYSSSVLGEEDWSPVAAGPADSEEETEVVSTADPSPAVQSDTSPSSCQQTTAAVPVTDGCQPPLSECGQVDIGEGETSCAESGGEKGEVQCESEQNVKRTLLGYSIQTDSPPSGSESFKHEHSETLKRQDKETGTDRQHCSTAREEEPDEASIMQGEEAGTDDNPGNTSREEEPIKASTTQEACSPTKKRLSSEDRAPSCGFQIKRVRLAEDFSRKKALHDVERKSREERRQMGAAGPWLDVSGIRQAGKREEIQTKEGEGREDAGCGEKKAAREGSGSREGKLSSRTRRIHQVTETNITQLLSALSQRDNPGDHLAKPLVISGILDYLVQAESPALRCVRTLVRVFQDLHSFHALLAMGAPLMVLETLLVREGGHLASAQDCQEAFLMEAKQPPGYRYHLFFQRRYQHWNSNCMQGSWPPGDSPPRFNALYVALALLDELQVACQTSFGRDVICKVMRSSSHCQRLIAAISLLTLAWTPPLEHMCVEQIPCMELVLEQLRKDRSPTSPWLRTIALALAVVFRIPHHQSECLEENPPPPFPHFPCTILAPSSTQAGVDDAGCEADRQQGLGKGRKAQRKPCCPYEKARPHFDLTLVCEGGEVEARRDLLVAGSLVFAAMLEGHYRETHQSRVALQDTSAPALTLLVHFLHGCGPDCPSLQPVLWHSPRSPDPPRQAQAMQQGGRGGSEKSKTAATTSSAVAEQKSGTKRKGNSTASSVEPEIDSACGSSIKFEDSQDAEQAEKEAVSTMRRVKFLADKPRDHNRGARESTEIGGRPGQENKGNGGPRQEEEEGVGLVLDLLALADRYALGELASYLQAALRARHLGPSSLIAVLLWGARYDVDLGKAALASLLKQANTIGELCHTFHMLLASNLSRELFLHTLDTLMHKPLLAVSQH